MIRSYHSVMLVTVQYPIVDMRAFLRGEPTCVPKPSWPTPAHSEFIRSLGPIRSRIKGGGDEYLAENSLCDCGRAIRFHPSDFARQWNKPKSFVKSFSRFYFDGYASG